MAERKKGKKRKEEYVAPGEQVSNKPSKEEFALAKWMRKNVPIKKTKFLNHNVEYFTARRAVDALLESKWCQGDEPLFKSREDIVDYLHLMLVHKFYHRARKVPVSEQELKGGKKGAKEKSSSAITKAESSEETKEKDKDKEKDVKQVTSGTGKDVGGKEKGTDAESSVVETKENKEQQPEKEKRKKKIRLDMHNDQRFVDSLDAYVWIYDPIPFHYWIIGTLLVLGAIAVCLFPLWPPSVRLGVYYLSVAAAGFLVTIIVLAVIRLIVFCAIWACTMGKHHLWILPNLTEDVGFLASFWPLYTYEYRGSDAPKKTKDKKKKKDKDSDAEEDTNGGDGGGSGTVTVMKKSSSGVPSNEEDKSKHSSQEDDEKHSEGGTTTDGGTSSLVEVLNASESESESSQRSSTGRDFEIVDQEELES